MIWRAKRPPDMGAAFVRIGSYGRRRGLELPRLGSALAFEDPARIRDRRIARRHPFPSTRDGDRRSVPMERDPGASMGPGAGERANSDQSRLAMTNPSPPVIQGGESRTRARSHGPRRSRCRDRRRNGNGRWGRTTTERRSGSYLVVRVAPRASNGRVTRATEREPFPRLPIVAACAPKTSVPRGPEPTGDSDWTERPGTSGGPGRSE